MRLSLVVLLMTRPCGQLNYLLMMLSVKRLFCINCISAYSTLNIIYSITIRKGIGKIPVTSLHLIGLKKVLLYVGLFHCCLPLIAWGGTEDNASQEPSDHSLITQSDKTIKPRSSQTNEISMTDSVDYLYQTLSERIINYSSSVDSFFSNERQNVESNQSRLIIGWGETLYEGGLHLGEQIIDAKIHLPQTKNRLRIDISVGQQDEETAGDRSRANLQQEESKFKVGLGLLLKAKERLNFRLSSGGRLKNNQLSAFVTARLRLSGTIKKWSVHITENMERDSKTGIQLLSSIDFERPISDETKFRSTTRRFDYYSPEYETTDHNFYLFQRLGDRKLLIYQLGAFGSRQPDEIKMDIDSYLAAFHFRRRIYKEWIYLDVIPQLIFADSNEFKPIAAITLRVSAIFGYQDQR